MKNFFAFLVVAFLFTSLFAFDYDLHLHVIEGKGSRTMICLHGYGANYKISETIGPIDTSLVSFNFPDHDLAGRYYSPRNLSFGTIRELLPALFVVKQYVIDHKCETIDLYGYSAGGGALINLIGILNTNRYDAELMTIDIGPDEKQTILSAICKGIVLLDTPLKSVEEIIDFRGPTKELQLLAENYHQNDLRPIDSLQYWKNLPLHVIAYFAQEDEVLSNRDDALFIERLKDSNNQGVTTILTGSGGHSLPHPLLWESYTERSK